jgi:hypothetical protein
MMNFKAKSYIRGAGIINVDIPYRAKSLYGRDGNSHGPYFCCESCLKEHSPKYNSSGFDELLSKIDRMTELAIERLGL